MLTNASESFILGKDTTILYKMQEIYKNISSNSLKGYWYSKDFFPNINEKQESFLWFDKDTLKLVYKFSELKYQKLELNHTINNFKEFTTFNVDFLEGSTSFLINNLGNFEIQMFTKDCLNKKYFIHLKKIDSLEYFQKELRIEKLNNLGTNNLLNEEEYEIVPIDEDDFGNGTD